MQRPSRQPGGLASLGLRGRSPGIGARLRAIFGGGGSLSEASWEGVEEALVAADVGPGTALELVDAARGRLTTGGADVDGVRRVLRDEIAARLIAVGSGTFDLGPSPSILLFVGVNGTGKTTTVAKLAARLTREGRAVALAAGDTFRAAAIEQLRIWGEQIGIPVVAQRAGADPGAVAFDAVTAADARGLDAVLIDTAGRLHTKGHLMAELTKIRKVVERRLPGQPRHVLLVLDATIGQNGIAQGEAFAADAGATGVIITKLDGTAKGGVAVAVADRFHLPIHFVGVGEGLDDLAPFDPTAYAEWLLTA